MAGLSSPSSLVVVMCVATLLLPASAAPLNWGKITLTEHQKMAISRVDDLLNDFLTQLEQDYRKRNPQVKTPSKEKVGVWTKVKPTGHEILETPADIVKPIEEDDTSVQGTLVEVPAEKTQSLTGEATPSQAGRLTGEATPSQAGRLTGEATPSQAGRGTPHDNNTKAAHQKIWFPLNN